MAKSVGSNNAVNLARATLEGLFSMKRKEEEEEVRGKELKINYVENE